MSYHERIVFLDTPTTNLDNDNNATHTFSYSLPVGTVNRVVILCLLCIDNTISAAFNPSVTFNGASMTHVITSQQNDAADDPGCVMMSYSPDSLAAGSYTVSITYAAAVIVSQAVIFTIDNVDHTQPGGGHSHGSGPTNITDANSGTGTSFIDLTIITTVDRTLVFQLGTIQGPTITPTGSQTVLFNQQIDGTVGTGIITYKEYVVPGSIGSDFSATFSSIDWCNAGASFAPNRRKIRVA
jgi:hypothetical protein